MCPRDKLCLSLGQTGLPLCKIRRKPGFCPGDRLGLSLGHTRFVPGATGPEELMFMCLFLA